MAGGGYAIRRGTLVGGTADTLPLSRDRSGAEPVHFKATILAVTCWFGPPEDCLRGSEGSPDALRVTSRAPGAPGRRLAGSRPTWRPTRSHGARPRGTGRARESSSGGAGASWRDWESEAARWIQNLSPATDQELAVAPAASRSVEPAGRRFLSSSRTGARHTEVEITSTDRWAGRADRVQEGRGLSTHTFTLWLTSYWGGAGP